MSLAPITASTQPMLATLLEKLRSPAAPRGYRPGETLARAQRNLGLADFEWLGPGKAAGRLAAQGPLLEVVERTEAHLLMHLVMCRWQYHCDARTQGSLTLELHHTGAVRRQGVRWNGAAPAPLQAMVEPSSPAYPALLALDFKYLRLAREHGRWVLYIEHMGASEVVNRLPAFRRYIPISAEQRAHLSTVFGAFAAVLPQL